MNTPQPQQTGQDVGPALSFAIGAAGFLLLAAVTDSLLVRLVVLVAAVAAGIAAYRLLSPEGGERS